MSKMDALRAMREARYEETQARARTAAAPAASKTPVKKAAVKAAPATATAATTVDDGLCGHRSMNGRTCTREQGHAAKSHRYS